MKTHATHLFLLAVTLETLSVCLRLWQKHRPDLLCLDIMMPGMDGYEVGWRLGADAFVRTPFGKHELIARIQSALRRTQRTQLCQVSSRHSPGFFRRTALCVMKAHPSIAHCGRSPSYGCCTTAQARY